MNLALKTAAAIDAKIEAEQESSFRRHLGGSVIGKKCQREIWYGFRWAIEAKHKAQLLRLFARGQLEESRFIEYLRKIGATVWPHDPNGTDSQGKPAQWRISDHAGHFGGSLDGVAVTIPDLDPNEAALLEFKTHGDKSFKKLIDGGVMASKWEHFIQMQVYMGKMELKFALYMAVNKDTDALHLEIVKFDPEIFERTIARAGNIIYANQPPDRISESPGSFDCKFCDYNRLCHNGEIGSAVNCRTCKFSRPSLNGLWHCGLRTLELDEKAQRAACGSYQKLF